MRVAPRFLVPFAFAVLALGCDKAPTGPWGTGPGAGTHDLVLDLTLSATEGSKDQPITIQAGIHNAGTASALQLQGGGACQWIKIDILDEGGQLVLTVDPCLPVPIGLCDFPSAFGPGESEQTSLSFAGTYRMLPDRSGCEPVDAPTGTYTAKVAFWVHWNATDPPEPLVRTVTFHWTGS